jgi:hypothetical protein
MFRLTKLVNTAELQFRCIPVMQNKRTHVFWVLKSRYVKDPLDPAQDGNTIHPKVARLLPIGR